MALHLHAGPVPFALHWIDRWSEEQSGPVPTKFEDRSRVNSSKLQRGM
eukprot:CAMPEP_0113258222 /NCGR_PEP_ID=MMETSP0008_2-20120614/15712_1 /TAXON_ID=97485 /ORGANISM="Prymnesium parvum" /LENGTH=47 /DNA_ID=CAMNT_0000106677 /DNA_START=465 /DNA_END=608 /DNA_ORIENTATION=- /assembly_acc=CAM_ASM_000153